MAVKIQVEFLWVVAPCCVVVGCQCCRGLNFGVLPQHCAALQSGKTQLDVCE
jgi:hypothetical protein